MSAAGRLATLPRAIAVLVLVGCRAPGTVGLGDAEVTIGGPAGRTWTGPCTYVLSTRWATRLPHRLVMGDSAHESLALSLVRAPRPGRHTVAPPSDGHENAIALLFDEHTVRGAVDGVLEVARRGEETWLTVSGQVLHRDTVPIHARCRYRPVAR